MCVSRRFIYVAMFSSTFALKWATPVYIVLIAMISCLFLFDFLPWGWLILLPISTFYTHIPDRLLFAGIFPLVGLGPKYRLPVEEGLLRVIPFLHCPPRMKFSKQLLVHLYAANMEQLRQQQRYVL